MESSAVLREPAHLVSPRARLMWMLSDAVASIVLLGALWGVLSWTGWLDVQPWWIGLAVAASLLYAVLVAQWRYRVHRWEVSESAVYTQTGWWARESRIAPMSRIQTVDYLETPTSRLFGLASVTVTTASAAGALKIAGLDRATARALAHELTVQADAVAGDAT